MDTAVLMEIENLRRASLSGLREKYRELFQEEAHRFGEIHVSRNRQTPWPKSAQRTGAEAQPIAFRPTFAMKPSVSELRIKSDDALGD